jgi:hypothetical protein
MDFKSRYFIGVIAVITVAISGCTSTSEPLQIERKGNVYDVVAWSCYDTGDYYKSNVSLLAWYTPDDSEYGVIELGSNDRFRAKHSRPGVQHNWDWDTYRLTIGADGTGYYFDFSRVKTFDEEVTSSEVYNCIRS